MGGSQSTSVHASLTDIAVKTTQESIKKCMAAATQDQLIELAAGGDITLGDIGQTQGVSLSMECVMSSDTQNEIKQNVATALAQAAEAMGSGVTSVIGASGASTQSYITTLIDQEVNQKDVQESIVSTTQRQKIGITAGNNIVIGNITQSQSASLVASMIMSSKGYSKVIGEIANKVDQSNKAVTTNPIQEMFEGIGNMFEGITSIFTKPMMYIFVIIVLIIAAGVFRSVMKNRAAEVEVIEEPITGQYDIMSAVE